MENKIQDNIVLLLTKHSLLSANQIAENLEKAISPATLKRHLHQLIKDNFIEIVGKGKNTKYQLAPTYKLLYPMALDDYFNQEIDERKINSRFNFEILENALANYSLFNSNEIEQLELLHQQYTQKIKHLSAASFKQNMERLAIDLSWKSSQIEGNTYTLLETEKLLKEKITAQGKTKDEAVMLLNHKEAVDFIIDNPTFLNKISIAKIEDLHSILIKELGIDRNIRKHKVGISGTNYVPLDNEFQIVEALKISCRIINNKTTIFEKALLTLLLLSYIQPFADGNKRTARIVSNAILIHHGYCPLSFRTVDSIEYKKAMLIFYEQNNISNFKTIFIEQVKFAIETYF